MTRPCPFVPEPWSSSEQPAREWLYATGSIEQALAYAQLFWPHFVVYKDCVLLALDLDGYDAWKERLPANSDIEAMLNHRHILDFFHDAGTREPHEWLISLGRLLKQCWEAKLQLQFPDRKFEILFDETQRTDPIDYQITFYQSL